VLVAAQHELSGTSTLTSVHLSCSVQCATNHADSQVAASLADLAEQNHQLQPSVTTTVTIIYNLCWLATSQHQAIDLPIGNIGRQSQRL